MQAVWFFTRMLLLDLGAFIFMRIQKSLSSHFFYEIKVVKKCFEVDFNKRPQSKQCWYLQECYGLTWELLFYQNCHENTKSLSRRYLSFFL